MADKVLEYWFAGDQSFNYRTKWFPTGNLELQQQADKTIYEEFGGLFNRAINNELEDWKSDAKMTIALIVVLDQFSRHIYRFSNIPAGAPERIMADKLALAISEHLLTIPHWDSGLSTAEMVFALMPLRHSATVERLDTVMKLIEQREQVLEEGQDLLGKFRKQTTRRLQHLQDREKVRIMLPLCLWYVTFVT